MTHLILSLSKDAGWECNVAKAPRVLRQAQDEAREESLLQAVALKIIPLRPFMGEDAEEDVVLPFPVDAEIFAGIAFFGEARF
jgi:hypothetical protein